MFKDRFLKACLNNSRYLGETMKSTIPDHQLRILEKQEIDCIDVQLIMGDYADGDLTETLKERVDHHICTCKKCAEFKDSYLKTIELAASLLEPKPLPVDLQNRLRAALNRRLGINLPPVS